MEVINYDKGSKKSNARTSRYNKIYNRSYYTDVFNF